MTQGEGLIGLLYALKGLLEAGVIWVITGAGLIFFFLLIVNFIGGKYGFTLIFGGEKGLFDKSKKIEGRNIVWALVLLFVVFGIYSLIALIGAILGVNSGPAGGLIIR